MLTVSHRTNDEMNLEIQPITISDAKLFVERHHRHHYPPVGALFAIAVSYDDLICGVAIVGRPVSRMLQNGYTAEVTRLCTDGTRNACSMLYAACWKAAKAMGYKKLITYTQTNESGSSLRGAGWKCIGLAGGGSWNSKTRPRIDRHPTQIKLKWQAD